MTERDVTVDGIRLHVREAGEGPALVMLHGLGANGANWDATAAAFADRWRVIVPDLPGHGRSAKPDAPYTVDFFAGIVRSLEQARLTILERCGHVPMVEQPAAFNQAVADFLPCVDAAPLPRRAAQGA